MRKWTVVFFLVTFTSLAWGEILPSKTIRTLSPRTAAIGGSHAALADDLTSLVQNPAGLYSVEQTLRVAELTLGLSGPVFTIANLGFQAAAGKDFAALVSEPATTKLLNSLYAGLNVIGPLSFGFAEQGLGFAIVLDSGMDIASAGSLNLKIGSWEKITLNSGYAFRVPLPADLRSTLDFGVNLKAFVQGRSEFTKNALEIPDVFASGAGAFLNNPFYMITGIGLDLGTRYSYDETISVGLALRDVFTPTSRSRYNKLQDFVDGAAPAGRDLGNVPLDVALGVMYTPQLPLPPQYVNGLKLLLDYRDIFGFVTHTATDPNPWLKLGFGAEVTVLEILALRAGLSEGLLAAGLGFDFGNIKINTAMYGSELSLEPGLRPVFNIVLGIEIHL